MSDQPRGRKLIDADAAAETLESLTYLLERFTEAREEQLAELKKELEKLKEHLPNISSVKDSVARMEKLIDGGGHEQPMTTRLVLLERTVSRHDDAMWWTIRMALGALGAAIISLLLNYKGGN